MSTERKTAIEVKNLSKDFLLPHERNTSIKRSVTQLFKKKDRTVEVQHALRDISFEVKEGEFFGILGRNGSGKSTLLKILAEIYTPTTGQVKHYGKLVPFIELGVGFNPELTGRENVFLNGALLGFSKKEIAEKYDDIVAFAELEDFMDQKLKNYSSGMQVRLAFSVATRAEADILLIDEVLAVGDADFQRKCFHYFKTLKKLKKTVVFVTHDMTAVDEYCDRAILINDSYKVKEGKAATIANEYLRLFNQEEEVTQADSTQNRWGAGGAQFSDITAKQDEEALTITATITADKDMSELVAGIRVISDAGTLITGANTLKSGGKPFDLTKGETRVFSWRIPNIFNSGTYTIDGTIRLNDGITICDNWDEAVTFKIQKKSKTPYLVEPPITLTTEKGD